MTPQLVLPLLPHEVPVLQTFVVDPSLEVTLPIQNPPPTPLVSALPELRPPARQFVPPIVGDTSSKQQNIPFVPVLEPPNLEVALANVNLVPLFPDDFGRLIQIPITSVPPASEGRDTGKEQTARTDSDQPITVNVISETWRRPAVANSVRSAIREPNWRHR